jgi:peptidoglycan/LPS O-acetylase OafA/YrhL
VSALAAERHTGTAGRRWWRHGSVVLDPRRNGFNGVRLLLALTVLVAHGWYLSGSGTGPHVAGENLGGWAVFGFFALSGYLITGSRWTRPLGEYLSHRVARIYPAFLVCLAVTAFVVAPIGYRVAHGSIDGFLSTATTPFGYLATNITLRMNAYDVAQTPAQVPYPGAWDGSLWSLYYEFACYLLVGALGCLALFRRRVWPLAGAFVVSVALKWQQDRVMAYTGNHPDVPFLLKLVPFFLAGGLLWTLRDRIVLSWPGAMLAAGVTLAVVKLVPGWGPQLAALPIAYGLLWFGAVLPLPELIRRHDISYGAYIYAFPVAQLLALAGAYKLGLAVYDGLAVVATVPLAAASWLLVERPIMRRARRSRTTPAAVPPVPALVAEAAELPQPDHATA